MYERNEKTTCCPSCGSKNITRENIAVSFILNEITCGSCKKKFEERAVLRATFGRHIYIYDF